MDGTGAVAAAFRYAAYGELAAASPAGATPTFLGYNGQLRDPSGLLYLRARWYDPATGRFLSRDPLRGDPASPATLNAFGYAHANPMLMSDPSGMCPSCLQQVLNGITRLGQALQRWLPWAQRAERAQDPVRRGQAVLGHYPEYLDEAERIGAHRFSVPMDVWEAMTQAQQWAANQRFLDRVIRRGDEVVLTTPVDEIVSGTILWREVQYLLERGYQVAEGGSRLLPGLR